MIEIAQDKLDVSKTIGANINKSVYKPSNLQFKKDNDADNYLNSALWIDKNTTNEKKELKEIYEPLKVYEVKNINEVWFGKKSLKTELLSFTVNWPLFWADNQPVWWYIDNGNKVKEFVDPAIGWGNFAVDNWIFGLWTDWKLRLIPYKDIHSTSIAFTWAFQNWPMLILNGKNMREHWTSTSKYNRSGIWFTSEGKAIIIYSDEPVTFKEFANLFVVHGCTDAIYLDGWPAAGYEDETGAHWELQEKATKLQFFNQDKNR